MSDKQSSDSGGKGGGNPQQHINMKWLRGNPKMSKGSKNMSDPVESAGPMVEGLDVDTGHELDPSL